MTTNRHKGASGGDANIPCPNCGGGYMTDCACQNTYTRGVNFTAFILQLNKLKFIKKNFLVQSFSPGDLVELAVF